MIFRYSIVHGGICKVEKYQYTLTLVGFGVGVNCLILGRQVGEKAIDLIVSFLSIPDYSHKPDAPS